VFGFAILVSGQSGPIGVAVNASHIYWANAFAGTINEANLNGANPQTLVSGQSEPIGVAVSA
jgi:hypothetical protein